MGHALVPREAPEAGVANANADPGCGRSASRWVPTHSPAAPVTGRPPCTAPATTPPGSGPSCEPSAATSDPVIAAGTADHRRGTAPGLVGSRPSVEAVDRGRLPVHRKGPPPGRGRGSAGDVVEPSRGPRPRGGVGTGGGQPGGGGGPGPGAPLRGGLGVGRTDPGGAPGAVHAGPPRRPLRDNDVRALLATAELRVLEAHANHTPARRGEGRLHRAEQDLLLVRLAADTGARRGELAALQIEDLDGRVLRIDKAVSAGVLTTPKSPATGACSPSAPPPQSCGTPPPRPGTPGPASR